MKYAEQLKLDGESHHLIQRTREARRVKLPHRLAVEVVRACNGVIRTRGLTSQT